MSIKFRQLTLALKRRLSWELDLYLKVSVYAMIVIKKQSISRSMRERKNFPPKQRGIRKNAIGVTKNLKLKKSFKKSSYPTFVRAV